MVSVTLRINFGPGLGRQGGRAEAMKQHHDRGGQVRLLHLRAWRCRATAQIV